MTLRERAIQAHKDRLQEDAERDERMRMNLRKMLIEKVENLGVTPEGFDVDWFPVLFPLGYSDRWVNETNIVGLEKLNGFWIVVVVADIHFVLIDGDYGSTSVALLEWCDCGNGIVTPFDDLAHLGEILTKQPKMVCDVCSKSQEMRNAA